MARTGHSPFFSRSLLGQMLLSVALAVLIAQVIAGALLYRAATQRSEIEIINSLAFQLASEREDRREARHGNANRSGNPRRERRRGRAIGRIENAARKGIGRDPEREIALAELLSNRGMEVSSLVVLDPLPPRERTLRRNRRFRDSTGIVLAGVRSADDASWRIAMHDLPSNSRAPLQSIVLQSAILYLVLIGGLAFLLRRITRPISDLTQRVEGFVGTTQNSPPLIPAGPEDTQRLIRAHNAMEARIAALLDEKDVMLGAIGHDLKTPLAALRIRIESVEDEHARDRMAAGIEDITRSLDDILSLARVGRPSDPIERTDLAALIASVVDEYEDMGESVVVKSAERLVVDLRATWLRRAIRNLVSNSLRYGESAQVSLIQEGADALITIEDDGPGIPDSDIAAMMEPFARGDGSRNRTTGGAGLGLTLARAIMAQHGGSLGITNIVGRQGSVSGLRTELRLPLNQDQ